MRNGVCKLTGRTGKFVKSHLLPQAFTRPADGVGFVCGGEGTRPKRGWTSWYDPKLVTRHGEDILSDYDNWGVTELRRLELVWSGWRDKNRLEIDSAFDPRWPDYGVRKVECREPLRLRLFFLSLLRRAAATPLEEFHWVGLSEEDMQQLTSMILNADPYPLDFYPTTLLQIISRGEPHNLGPTIADFGERDREDGTRNRFLAFRFYFDGLISHIHFKEGARAWGNFNVGGSATLSVLTQTWENSFQHKNMLEHIVEGSMQWPGTIRKLIGSDAPGRNFGGGILRSSEEPLKR